MNHASALGDMLGQAPTVSSARAALAILRQLTHDGDVPAARTLAALLARKLGHPGAVPAIEGLVSLDGVLQQQGIPALLRVYLLALLPRELMFQANKAADIATPLPDEVEYAHFQRLVRRGDVLEHEALKAYCVNALAASMKMSTVLSPAHVQGGWMRALDGIHSECKVVAGTNANTKFEIGRDLILGITAGGFGHAVLHEMGHHLVEITLAARGVAESEDQGAALCANDLASLANVVPDAIRNALSGTKQRDVRLSRNISLFVTVVQARHGSYMHWSLTRTGAPIELRTAVLWAALLLELLGVGTAETAVAFSPRGVFHFGFVRKIKADSIVWPHQPHDIERRLAGVSTVASAWLEELTGAAKIGPDGAWIPVALGLQEPGMRVYAAAPEALHDLQACEALRSQAPPATLLEEQAHALMGVAVRCAYPPLIKPLLDRGVRPEDSLGGLGSSMAVAGPPGPADKRYLGPTAANTLTTLRWLHDQGVDLDAALDETGTTLLLDAVRQESAAVPVLLSLGADGNRADSDGNTALHACAGSSWHGLAGLVLEAGADHDRRNAQGQTALALAAALDDADAVDALLQAGANADARDAAGATPLMSARSGNVVRRLVASGADPDATDHAGRTPLIAAAEAACAEVVRTLIQVGADPERSDDLGSTALHHAAWRSGEPASDCLVALLDAGCDADEESGNGATAVMVAAHAGNVDGVRVLLSRGANVDARDADGNTPLLFALDPSVQLSRDPSRSARSEEVVRALVEAGADVNGQNHDGQAPLHLAARAFTSSLARTLLKLGASPDPRSRDGQTPLMDAAAQGHHDMVAALVEAGADVNARDGRGNTPLHFAVGYAPSPDRAAEAIKRLKARGARP
ncbi:ankyrin repeat domain-containing protein [Ramlibacter ginsenosidimutans]|uniref:Ankyrin repeat domain-containing protein n=1 Tax=Ramlibacter ginsenosidimutans TaxID=502333 RepID=A0A934TQM6_9BURK|nr:ankyrin repeat domain-containing protein [Ramlibacter ginsenosidimutans]MBK6005350.1 ankyrin repeat domain-containing protein [Ramlibacter ginsenosidimutans]